MIVEIDGYADARIIMARREGPDGKKGAVTLKVEFNTPHEHSEITLVLDRRECTKIGNYLNWLAEKIEEEENPS